MKKNILSIVNLLGYEIVRFKKSKRSYWPYNTVISRLSYEEDIDFHNKYDYAQMKTQMIETDNALRRQRHYSLMQLFKNSLSLEGDIAECGTFHGLSAYQFSDIMSQHGKTKVFHIFDSFEGLSEIKNHDKSKKVKISDKELQKQFLYGLEKVKDNLRDFRFIKYYRGWIPSRFQEVEDKKFSFVHIDVDLYQPIKDSFEFFFPRVIKGGIMVFDDYGYTSQFPGAKKAVDEVLQKIDKQMFLALPSGNAFLIK